MPGFGAALAIVVGVSVIPISEQFLVPINAFFFSMITCILIYFIGRTRTLSKETMVLAGIAILFLFHSALALLQYPASEEELQAIVFWLFGSLTKVTWSKLAIVSTVLVVIAPLLVKDAWKLTALRLGDEKAKSLGVDIEKLRFKVLILVSILTGAAVCFVGYYRFYRTCRPSYSQDARRRGPEILPACFSPGRGSPAFCCINRQQAGYPRSYFPDRDTNILHRCTDLPFPDTENQESVLVKLQIESLNFAYGSSKPVLTGIHIQALPGEITCLIGPNAAGKSTLLKCVAGLLKQRGT